MIRSARTPQGSVVHDDDLIIRARRGPECRSSCSRSMPIVSGDFRGDTVHPSTLEAMHELGLLDDLLKFPHQKASQINGASAGLAVTVADFSHLPVRCPYIAFMPQWATTRPACISISPFAFLARTPTTRPSCLISPMVALVQFSGAFRPDSSESRAAGTCADSKTARLTRSIGWATV